MKKTFTLLLVVFITVITCNAQTYEWAKSMGGLLNEYANSIAVDVSGNVYTTGRFEGTVDFDPGVGTSTLTSSGERDVFISKLDAAGNFVWAKSMGGLLTDEATSIAADGAGNVYTTGVFYGTSDFDPGAGTFNLTSAGQNDIFISKLDATGNFLWAKRIGGTSFDVANSIIMDGSGNVYVTGYFFGTTDFDPGAGTSNLISAGQSDIFISKLDADGNFLWVNRMGGTSQDRARSIALDGSGNVYTTGLFSGTCDFDPGVGTNNLTSAGGSDIFISKLDALGNFVWAKSMGGTLSDDGTSITVDGSSNVFTTGYFSGTGDFDSGAGTFNLTSAGQNDIFISKLDVTGNFLWAKSMGGTTFDEGNSIVVDGFGNVYTSGYFEGTSDFDSGAGTSNLTSIGGRDIFISKVDASGNYVWAKSMGGTSGDESNSIALDGSNNIYTTGFFSGTVDFDPGVGTSNLTSAGQTDIFISKLDQCLITTSSITAAACSSFVSPSGNYTWTTSGIFMDTIPNVAGCDSVITINLTINNSSTSLQSVTSCNSYTWPLNSQFYTTSGVYNFTITNAAGCDSIVTLNFTRLLPTSGTAVISSCNSITWIDGITYSSNNSTATHTLTNAVGCDSIVTLNFTRLLPTSGTAVISSCNPITWIDGITYSSNNSTATYTLTNASGCDSVVTLNFTRLLPTSGTAVISSCNPITWIDGNTYATSNSTATYTLTNAAGCDSIVTLNFTRLLPSAGTATITSCNPITWINGVTYSSSNSTATHVLTNAAGCDSIVTLNFTRLMPSSSISVISSCDPITWIDGNTYSTSNSIATHTLTNAAGCDSVVTLNYTRLMANTGVSTVNTCNTYTWINGITYTSSTNTPTFTLTNAAGCDSIVTLNLTINSVSNLTTTLSGATISANNSSASYQWLDCSNGFAPIPGQAAQTFSPSTNGSYAVQLTQNGCVDTSACVAVNGVGINENTLSENFTIYPNPTSGSVIIDFENNQTEVKIALHSVAGQLIKEELELDMVSMSYEIDAPNGVYILKITNSIHQTANIRIIKE